MACQGSGQRRPATGLSGETGDHNGPGAGALSRPSSRGVLAEVRDRLPPSALCPGPPPCGLAPVDVRAPWAQAVPSLRGQWAVKSGLWGQSQGVAPCESPCPPAWTRWTRWGQARVDASQLPEGPLVWVSGIIFSELNPWAEALEPGCFLGAGRPPWQGGGCPQAQWLTHQGAKSHPLWEGPGLQLPGLTQSHRKHRSGFLALRGVTEHSHPIALGAAPPALVLAVSLPFRQSPNSDSP